MKLNEREKKFVTVGGIAWAAILFIFVIVLPWQEKRSAEKKKLIADFEKLKEVKMLHNRKARLEVRESALLVQLLNQKETFSYGRQINEVQTMLQNIAKSKGITITDARPDKTALISKDLGVRKATIKLTATAGDPKKFTEFFVDIDYMPGLLNIEEFSMQHDPRKAKGVTFNLTVSTLVKEEKAK